MIPRRRPLRIALVAVAAVIILIIGVGAVEVARFDPNAYKPDIVAAVKRATGRDIALNGKIGLKPSLWPTIQVSDVTFSNPPGFSRPQMASLQQLDLQLALLPLLSGRFAIDRLVLVHPDILLETNKAGQPNWQMTPQAAPPAQPGENNRPHAPKSQTTSGQASGGATRTQVSIAAIRIQDGTLGYRDDRTGKTTTLAVSRLDASAASPNAPLHINANATYNGIPLSLTANTGSLARLQDPTATTPWPVKLTLKAASADLTADGSLTHPLLAKGYNLAVTATIPDASTLTPLLQGFVPPPLHDVHIAAKVADSGGPIPTISALTLHVGASDLSARMPGLTLDHLDITSASPDQPLKADAAGKLDNQPLTLAATTGPLASLLPGAKPAAFPIDVTLQAAGATITAKGTIANATALSGANIALNAQIPDLGALSPLLRHPLPALKQIAFKATLTDPTAPAGTSVNAPANAPANTQANAPAKAPANAAKLPPAGARANPAAGAPPSAPGGLRNGAALHGIILTTAQGDLSGDAAFSLAPRPTLTANLKSSRIDLDALQAAIDQAPNLPTPPPSTTSAPASATSASNPPPTPPQPATHSDHLFSRQPLPFNDLRTADADVTLAVADLHAADTDTRDLSAHLVLKDGKLTLSPVTATLAGGHMTATATVDATQKAPPIHLAINAPGLPLKTLLALAHQPPYATGNLEILADLSGAGDSPHAIAASLDGSLGLAIPSGTIDNRLLGSLLGKVMNTLNALNLVGKGGDSSLKCFGMRMEAHHGIATVAPLVLSSSLLTMSGAGRINLANETLDLALRPQARIAGTGLVIPISVTGRILDPAVNVNKLGAAESNAGSIAGAVLGDATPLGIVGGLLGGDKLLQGSQSDICPAALAAARGQKAPPASQPAASQPAASKPAKPNPATLLRNLFR